jgi:superfamily II DNA or RNA helicase
MIYAIVRYFVALGKKILLVVPTTSLVEQMFKDFQDYGWDAENYCHRIYAGRERINTSEVTITTWQSVYNLDRSFFEEYDVVIGDEAHLFKSKSLIGIMDKLHHAKYRYGFTGTLDGTQTHKWVLEGLFGPSYKVTGTKKLIDEGHLSTLDIQCLVLKYKPQKFDTYEDEIQFLIGHEKRNKFITNLAIDLTGNTLILFSRVEAHGKVLFEIINSKVTSERKVFFIHGGVDAEDRELVRKITEEEKDAIIVASYGTFSTGINIKNLHNVIFASPSKSRVRNLQSIGRVLRKGKDKVKARLYDIADDLTTGSRKNYTLNHFIERIKIYVQEQFNYDIISIDIKD